MNWAEGLDENDYLFVDDIPKMVEALGHPRMVNWGAGFDAQDLWKEEKERGTLVFTANYDGGPHYQQLDWPGNDLRKELLCVDWDALAQRRDAYPTWLVGPCCRPEHCNPSHFLSVKTDRFTWYTLPSLPDWCGGWYTVNCNVEEPGIHNLPFGLHYDDPTKPFADVIAACRRHEKTGLVYVNFALYSAKRITIREAWRGVPHATFRDKANLARDEYLAELASHKFILCPPGCGLDQFRIYEALYVGSIPVVESSPWANQLMDVGLPVMTVPDLRRLPPPSQLEKIWEGAQGRTWDLSWTSKRWWKDRLENLAHSLSGTSG